MKFFNHQELLEDNSNIETLENKKYNNPEFINLSDFKMSEVFNDETYKIYKSKYLNIIDNYTSYLSSFGILPLMVMLLSIAYFIDNKDLNVFNSLLVFIILLISIILIFFPILIILSFFSSVKRKIKYFRESDILFSTLYEMGLYNELNDKEKNIVNKLLKRYKELISKYYYTEKPSDEDYIRIINIINHHIIDIAEDHGYEIVCRSINSDLWKYYMINSKNK